MSDSLFSEFEGVSYDRWKQQAIKDLKGKDFDQTLVWRSLEGLDIQPYYEHSFTENQALDQIHSAQTKAKLGWQNREVVLVTDAKAANQQALAALQSGASALLFDLSRQPLANVSLTHLLDKIKLSEYPVYFRLNHQTVELVNALSKVIGYHPKGGLYDDPLAQWMTDGNWHEDTWTQLAVALRQTTEWTSFGVVGIEGNVFHDAGASAAEEMAFALASGITVIDHLSHEGLKPSEIAPKLEFRLAVGTDYFVEIAKLRAFRYLWGRIAQAWGFEPSVSLYASSSWFYTAAATPYTNMLRGTTEAMSAVVGGCDALSILPYDAAYGHGSEFSRRIARNISLILRDESYLDKTLDPAAGSYYLDQLTLQLSQKAWRLLEQVEAYGGLIPAFEQGFVQSQIKQTRETRLAQLQRGGSVMVGVNKFRHDDAPLPSPTEAVPNAHQAAPRVELLPSVRLSAALENTDS